MENLNLNLPPFYVGQKVVCVSQNKRKTLVVGNTYTVLAIKQCRVCKTWYVGFSTNHNNGLFHCCTAEQGTGFRYSRSDRFAPIEERFISFSEVIEIESPLIGAN